MKKVIVITIASLALGGVFMGCSSKSESGAPSGASGQSAASNEASSALGADAGLARTWTSQCKASIGLGQTMREVYRFEASNTQITEEYFSDAHCQQGAVQVQYAGSYELGQVTNEGDQNVQEININPQRVNVTPVTEQGLQALQENTFCAQSEWQMGKVQDMTEQSRDQDCPLKDTPHTVYDIFTIQNDELRFGQIQGEMNKSEPGKRAIQVDQEAPLKASGESAQQPQEQEQPQEQQGNEQAVSGEQIENQQPSSEKGEGKQVPGKEDGALVSGQEKGAGKKASGAHEQGTSQGNQSGESNPDSDGSDTGAAEEQP